jgi:cytochrome c1
MHSFKYLILPVLVLPFLFMDSNVKKSENNLYKVKPRNHAVTVIMHRAEAIQPKISAQKGKQIAKDNGCFACHSTDGTKMAGPTWKNLYGKTVHLKGGSTVTADSSYIKESIKEPSKQITKGFSPTMPSFSYLKDAQIKSIIAYIKSISNTKSKK